jgi:hypothetical protein
MLTEILRFIVNNQEARAHDLGEVLLEHMTAAPASSFLVTCTSLSAGAPTLTSQSRYNETASSASGTPAHHHVPSSWSRCE